MPRNKTPTFVLELPIVSNTFNDRELTARFNAGLRIYNTCLNEAETRRKLMQDSKEYIAAKAIRPLTIKNKKGEITTNPERTKAFRYAAKIYRFTDYDLHSFATQSAKKSVWIADKLDSDTLQKLGTRAFKASSNIIFGNAKKIRFKGFNRFRSLEGKRNIQGIRFKDEQIVWCGLKLDLIINYKDPVVNHALKGLWQGKPHKVKYVRIVKRELNGKTRYFAQLVMEGVTFIKPKNVIRDGLAGLDLNVSNVGFVADQFAELYPLADNVPSIERDIKRIQRKMERSKRVNNPDCFEADFTVKKNKRTVKKKGKFRKGKKVTKFTKNYKRLSAKKRELERVKSAYVKTEHRRLINDILSHANVIMTEDVTVKTWQKLWGKAISAKSPGLFMSELIRKAERAGGNVIKFSTYKTACSQTHLDGVKRPKTLSERVHKDVTGPVMHRDLYSAFLSRLVSDDSLPPVDVLQREYAGMEQYLLQGWKRHKSYNQTK